MLLCLNLFGFQLQDFEELFLLLFMRFEVSVQKVTNKRRIHTTEQVFQADLIT